MTPVYCVECGEKLIVCGRPDGTKALYCETCDREIDYYGGD